LLVSSPLAVRAERCRNTIVPHIYIDGAAAAIDFYERACGALELFRIARPDGRIVHAELSVCGSVVMQDVER
jgi:PhnB protein